MADIHDLMELTGMGRQAVTTAVDNGRLPGYRVGRGNKIWVPDEALDLLRKGHWRKPQGTIHDRTPFVIDVTSPRNAE